jgi:hypothetical protein
MELFRVRTLIYCTYCTVPYRPYACDVFASSLCLTFHPYSLPLPTLPHSSLLPTHHSRLPTHHSPFTTPPHSSPPPTPQVADRFGIDRLKRLCELEMLAAITTESVAPILYTAGTYCSCTYYTAYNTNTYSFYTINVYLTPSFSVNVFNPPSRRIPRSEPARALHPLRAGQLRRGTFHSVMSFSVFLLSFSVFLPSFYPLFPSLYPLFGQVSRTSGFEEMGRTNVELVFEILRRR